MIAFPATVGLGCFSEVQQQLPVGAQAVVEDVVEGCSLIQGFWPAPELQMLRWQDAPYSLDGYTDSDWAGDKTTRKSTSGGIAFLGGHCIKSWSSNQTIIALSSAEAELYALLKGASQTLGLKSMAADFRDELECGLWSDASAAIAISQRSGLGKLRHIQTQFLWLQELTLQLKQMPNHPKILLEQDFQQLDFEHFQKN